MATRRAKSPRVALFVVMAMGLIAVSCGAKPAIGTSVEVTPELRRSIEASRTGISGGGASFPDAFYQAVNADFNTVAGSEAVTYAKSGSADGRTQLVAGTLDFAGSDSLPSAGESLPSDLLYFPTVAAPITVSYNLPGVNDLALSPGSLARIFQADITNWNSPEIAAENPDIDLPDSPITVVHRSDGSGTTKNFTAYLATAAADLWTLGKGDEIAWPRATQGAEKNSGVAEVIKQTIGSVGYVDLGDAAKADLRIASVQNAAGTFTKPTVDAVTAALEGTEVADDLTFDPLNAPAEGAYPITAPTWILVSATHGPAEAEALRTYLRFLLGPAQSEALALGYVPLPESLLDRALAQIDQIVG